MRERDEDIFNISLSQAATMTECALQEIRSVQSPNNDSVNQTARAGDSGVLAGGSGDSNDRIIVDTPYTVNLSSDKQTARAEGSSPAGGSEDNQITSGCDDHQTVIPKPICTVWGRLSCETKDGTSGGGIRQRTRKRQSSANDIEPDSKKQKGDKNSKARVKTKVNPKYKTKKQTSSGAAVESSVLTECMPESMPDFNNLDIPGLAKMIFNMQREMRSMFNTVQKIDSNMNDMIANIHVRIDNIEKTVEEKVTNNMKKTLDNRITNETNKIKKMVEDKVSDAKRDILAECKADFEGATNNIHDLIDDLKHESKENQSPNGIERNIIL